MANADKVRRAPIMVTLSDGIERELAYTLNSFISMEEKFGSVDAAMEALESNSMSAVRFMLFVGLADNDPTLTELKVGALINVLDMNELMESLMKAIETDSPAPEQGNANPNPTALQ